MNTKGIFVLILLLVIGVVAFMTIEEVKEGPVENVSESVSSSAEDVGDAFEDVTN